jgi:hypothetical protein
MTLSPTVASSFARRWVNCTGRVVRKELLDGARQERRVGPQFLQLVRAPEPGQHTVADQVCRRLVPRGQEKARVGIAQSAGRPPLPPAPSTAPANSTLPSGF